MTLLRELIDIPEHVQKGDFVLHLSEGVIDPAGTLGEYVVTPELVKCFDQALDFIRDAVARRTSKATYLHGSFGAGKSHFMAVLHLILQGNTQARGIPELAGVIAKHNAWMGGKKFLMVPYHMIGAHSMESGILGGYVDFIRRTHPTAPIPACSGRQAVRGRPPPAEMGDEAFFGRLNAAHQGGGTRLGRPGGPGTRTVRVGDGGRPRLGERTRLVSDLVGALLPVTACRRRGSGRRTLARQGRAYESARRAWYDALLLFLDELILWLATRSVDLTSSSGRRPS